MRRTCACLLALAGFQAAGATDSVHPAQVLIERAASAMRTDPKASSRAAQAALELLAIQPNPDLEIQARTLLCGHLSERDRAAAEEQAAQARALLPQAARPGLLAGVLECEGTILETAGENARARQLFDQAVSVAADAGDEEMLAASLFSRGYVLGVLSEYAAGLADLKRAQALYDSIGLPNHALTTINSIAILYNRMGDYAQARDMYERAVKAQRDAGLRRELGVTLHNLGRAHENLQEWKAAQTAFQESYTIARDLQYERGEAYALRGLAAVMNANGDPQGALAMLDRAAELQQRTPDARLYAQIQLARGVALHRIGNLPASAAALRQALDIYRGAEARSELRETYSELAAVEAEMGAWREAHAYQVQAQATAEQIFRNQIDQRFATLKIEFDTSAKDKENALLTRENEANQKALAQERRARRLQAIVIALTVALAGLLATLAVHQWRTTRRMRRLAMTDELTGVPNRRAVLSRLEPLLQEAGAGACAMLIIDIDHFKSINDQHGHPEGDEALKLIACALRDKVHDPAFLGRLGGEEFVVVLPGVAQQTALRLAEGFREHVMTIDTRRWLAERRITVSIGLTMSRQGDTPSSMLQRADAALYEAKRAGRNCVRVHLPPADHGSCGKDEASGADATQPEFA